MIELTQEQWRIIARDEHPTAIEPASQTAYVVVRKDEYDKLRAVSETGADAAYVLRVAWMRRMGLDEDEIADSIRDDPPRDVRQEVRQLRALDGLDRTTPPAEVLRRYAVRY